MPLLKLSMGIRLLPQHIQSAEYYPCGSVGSSALLNGFLCIRTGFGKVRVRGSDAAQDATLLEEAGVQVCRSLLGDS